MWRSGGSGRTFQTDGIRSAQAAKQEHTCRIEGEHARCAWISLGVKEQRDCIEEQEWNPGLVCSGST